MHVLFLILQHFNVFSLFLVVSLMTSLLFFSYSNELNEFISHWHHYGELVELLHTGGGAAASASAVLQCTEPEHCVEGELGYEAKLLIYQFTYTGF